MIERSRKFRSRWTTAANSAIATRSSIRRRLRFASASPAKPRTRSPPSGGGQQKGSKTLAICNVFGSYHARGVGTILTHAGPEIAWHPPRHSRAVNALIAHGHVSGPGTRTQRRVRETFLLEFMRLPHKMETVLQGDETGIYETASPGSLPAHQFPVSRTRDSFSDRTEGAFEVEGNFLHPRGGLSVPAK